MFLECACKVRMSSEKCVTMMSKQAAKHIDLLGAAACWWFYVNMVQMVFVIVAIRDKRGIREASLEDSSLKGLHHFVDLSRIGTNLSPARMELRARLPSVIPESETWVRWSKAPDFVLFPVKALWPWSRTNLTRLAPRPVRNVLFSEVCLTVKIGLSACCLRHSLGSELGSF